MMAATLMRKTRLAAAVVALVAWAGMLVQFRATIGQGYSVGETLWILVRFFTILTNLALAVVMTMEALGKRIPPIWLGGVTLAMALVGVVYITLLRGLLDLSGGALLADTVLHKVTPVLAALWWLVFAPKGRLGWRTPFVWALYPLVYFAYALVRGSYEGIFAYPFINYLKIGVPAVALNAVVIAACFVLAGFGMVALDRRLGASRAAG